MQLSLDLLESPAQTLVWKQLSEAERQAVVGELAGMILAAALAADQRLGEPPAADKQTQRSSSDA